MARTLTGIQCTGIPHLGNLMGTMIPSINLVNENTNSEFLFFIADLHTLTANKDSAQRRSFSYSVAAAWLACGLNVDKAILFRQSRVPVVCELAWYLNCFAPYPMLANAHSFKEKSANLSDVNAGLFTYPVLMAADILLYNTEIVPVGKDQIQHIEIARDIASIFNKQYGQTFILPKAKFNDNIDTILGIDGRKMSKSYGNTIDVFLEEKKLLQTIMKIKTDSTSIDSPKIYENCPVYNIYKTIATKSQIDIMQTNYLSVGYGYSNAKQDLFNLINERFSKERKLFEYYMQNIEHLEKILLDGEIKATKIANETMKIVRNKLGYN